MSTQTSTQYEAVIGLEVHAELLTETKIFCGCKAEFGGEPNAHVCAVCAGMPGALPVLNRRVLEMAIQTGLALNCEIPAVSKFDRKNYFYPDLPKAYQISQFDQPICGPGHLDVPLPDGTVKRVGITRAHMEEDAGKLVHQGAAGLAGSTHSLVDLNRAGVPLLEIVSEPDLRTPEECKAYVSELRNILVYLGVNDGRLEQGSLRCDANVSIRPVGQAAFGTKTEIKNMNSLTAIERAVRAEIKRQEQALADGERIVQETRLWNEERQTTVHMRSKEGSSDYRYFPDPDLIPMLIPTDQVAALRSALPELPAAKRERYQAAFELPAYDAGVLVADARTAAFFEGAVAAWGENPRAIAKWMNGEVLALGDAAQALTPVHLAEIVKLVETGAITRASGKKVLAETAETGEAPAALVEKHGFKQINDAGAITAAIDKVLTANPKQVAEYKGGKQQVLGFLVGQVMRETRGQAKPDAVNALLAAALSQPD